MPRVKRGTTSLKRRRKILTQVKGYRFGRSTKERQAKEAIAHAGIHAFAHRRAKKRDFRGLWQIQINAAVRNLGLSYSKFMGALEKKKIKLNRKILAELAEKDPQTFEKIIKEVTSIPT